jgi:hypothetical protein
MILAQPRGITGEPRAFESNESNQSAERGPDAWRLRETEGSWLFK